MSETMTQQPNISNQQAHYFARAIYADVAAYIASHQKEYLKFLQTYEDESEEHRERS